MTAVDLTLLSSAEVAAMLGLKPQTLRKMRLEGRSPPYIRLGGPMARVLYRRADVDAWLDARTWTSTSQEAVATESAARERSPRPR